jgi:ABC-type multidrug transport system fused ATPase/permease subunit
MRVVSVYRDFGKWPTRKSLRGEYERSGGHYLFFLASLFFHPRGLCGPDHPTCFSFLETSCSFTRLQQSPLASRDVLPTGPPNKAVYSLTGNASSPFHTEPAQLLQEVLSAIGVVKAFGREDYEQQRLERESAESVQLALHARSLEAKLSPLAQIIVAPGTALVLWFGGGLVVGGTVSAGSLVVFIWYLGKMYKPMEDFAMMTDAFTKAAVRYERVRGVMETPPMVRDMPGAKQAPPPQGEIEFQNVGFTYTGDRPILSDVTLERPKPDGWPHSSVQPGLGKARLPHS